MVASHARRARVAIDGVGGATPPSPSPSTMTEFAQAPPCLADELKFELERCLEAIRARDRRIAALETRIDARERELTDALDASARAAASAREREVAQSMARDVVLRSANARARAAEDDRDEILARYVEMRRALEAREGEIEDLRRLEQERECERRDAWVARAFAERGVLRRALARWARRVSFSIRAREFARETREQRQKNTLMSAFAAWRGRAMKYRLVVASRRRVDERALQRALVHWSLAVEMSRTGEAVLVRRMLLRWYDATMDAKEDVARRDAMFIHFAEQATTTFARHRRHRALSSAFHSWLVVMTNAKRAKIVALELLASERRGGGVGDNARGGVDRLKALRRNSTTDS